MESLLSISENFPKNGCFSPMKMKYSIYCKLNFPKK